MIFSGEKSKKFWDTIEDIRGGVISEADCDLLYKYGCKAQELEAVNKKLADYCNKIRLHELNCMRRDIGYDSNVHHLALVALDAAKKAKMTL